MHDRECVRLSKIDDQIDKLRPVSALLRDLVPGG